ncbi:hypothetical protein GGR54DRAFT_637806 [Hypoxylon sp. NC1633]|nr:hypothetical protein GGR54DRAFT_637806 [Hypoxylon sp. NC1633]
MSSDGSDSEDSFGPEYSEPHTSDYSEYQDSGDEDSDSDFDEAPVRSSSDAHNATKPSDDDENPAHPPSDHQDETEPSDDAQQAPSSPDNRAGTPSDDEEKEVIIPLDYEVAAKILDVLNDDLTPGAHPIRLLTEQEIQRRTEAELREVWDGLQQLIRQELHRVYYWLPKEDFKIDILMDKVDQDIDGLWIRGSGEFSKRIQAHPTQPTIRIELPPIKNALLDEEEEVQESLRVACETIMEVSCGLGAPSPNLPAPLPIAPLGSELEKCGWKFVVPVPDRQLVVYDYLSHIVCLPFAKYESSQATYNRYCNLLNEERALNRLLKGWAAMWNLNWNGRWREDGVQEE